MLTIKYRDNRGSETIQPGVSYTSFHEGTLTAQLEEGGSVTFGPNWGAPGGNPIAFVMNEAGATVAKYEFYPMADPDGVAFAQADLSAEALAQAA